MSRHFKEAEHLVRLAGLFVLGMLAFVVLRAIFIPAGFGELGHFRAGALADNRARPLAFAGRAACADCHSDVVEARMGSQHARIGCEACHGALARHAEDPEALTPERPDGPAICLRCHTPGVAKPAAFPQVDPSDHGDGEPCTSCHQPHNPKVL